MHGVKEGQKNEDLRELEKPRYTLEAGNEGREQNYSQGHAIHNLTAKAALETDLPQLHCQGLWVLVYECEANLEWLAEECFRGLGVGRVSWDFCP